MKNRLSILCVLGVAGSALASVSFAPVKNYPNLGFMFPRIAQSKAEPLATPQAHAYLLSGDGLLDYEDRFAPFDLWFGAQCCARWRDTAGNRLVLGRMTHRLPLFSEEHVSRETFGVSLADDANLIDPKNRSHLDEWVATFVDTPVYEPEPLKLNTFTLDEVLRYPCEEAHTLIYAFRPRRIGNAKNFDWFCATLQAPGEADMAALRARFEEAFIGQIALPPRSSKDEGAAAEELSTLRKGEKSHDQPNHPVRLEAKRSIQNYEAWWYAETDGYIILSDVDTEIGKSVVRELQETLPALHKAYAKLLPPLAPANEIALVRLFQTNDDYARYVGEDGAWSSGMWMPGRRELVLYQQESKEEMMRVIRHEAFHQYLSHAYCMMPAAPWINEGHACLFENSRVVEKGKVVIDEDPARCALLLENLETAVALLPRLLRTTYEEFYDGTPRGRQLKYAMAWALAYYLQKGVPQESGTPFKAVLADYAAALATTHDGADATLLAFADLDLSLFQNSFREFWLKRRNQAKRYDPVDP